MFPKSFPKTCGYEVDFLPLQQLLTNPLFYGNIIRISAGDVAQQERIVPRGTTHHPGQETEEGGYGVVKEGIEEIGCKWN